MPHRLDDGRAREAMERFFAASNDLLCVLDRDGRVELANPAWARALGWPPAELAGVALRTLIHPEDCPRLRPLACSASPDGAAATARIRRRDGGWTPMVWRRTATLAEGSVALSAAPDATSGPAAIRPGLGGFAIAAGSRDVRWSDAARRILGIGPEAELMPLEEALSFVSAEALAEASTLFDALLGDGAGFDRELPMVGARGARIWARISAAPAGAGGAVGAIEDVTDGRARRLRRERLATLAERADAGVTICDAERRIEWVNEAFERMSGYALREIRGLTQGEVLQCAETDPATVARIRAALDAGGPVRCEIFNRARDGIGLWFDLDIQPIRDNGRLTGFSAIQTEITARRATEIRLRDAEAAAREAGESLLSAVEALPDGFVLFDRDDRLVICNERYRRYLPRSAPAIRQGATLRQILECGLANGEYPMARGDEAAWLENRMALHNRPESSTEVMTAEGRWLRVVERTMPDGRRVGLRIDITEERGQRRRLEAILEGTRVGVWEGDLLTGLSVYNERYAEMLGYTLQEMQPATEARFNAQVHPDDLSALRRAVEQHLAGFASHYEHEFRMRHRDGHYVWVQSRGKLMERTSSGAPWKISGTHQDITARKRDEAALEEALRRAEQASIAKSRFLANMSHEIRTPLNGVIGLAEVLARTELGADQRRMLAAIRESGGQLLNVINDILDVSKIEAGRMEIEETDFDPAELAQRVRSVHALRAREQRLAFEVAVTGVAGAWLRGDPHRILQILNNLVSNALKFTEAGAVYVTIDAGGDGLTLTVSDTGMGMTSEQVARVFEDFVQADSSTTRRFGGTGLGMAIVRRIAELMGGRVALESAPGAGSTVVVTLPLAQVAPAGAPAVAENPADALPGLRVLAADDNEINRMVLEAMLDALKVAVVMADGGASAVRLARDGGFDAILLDISMPDVDGVTALKAIRAEEEARGAPPTPAIAVTANALTHQTDLYLSEGFDRCVAKPIRQGDLAAALAAARRDGLAGRAARLG